ncbi:sensor histidine kinase [Euzebya tangerina]|uniref:sensor histidine kinase n=1 Tax=Euzebya tangerina TaxID=591198 RepID=UPI000E311666|nr:sensor histidine kinase [Euzebya tangerina]
MSPTPSTSVPTEDTLDRYWHGLYYALVVGAAVISLSDADVPTGPVLGGTAFLVALYWTVIQRPGIPWGGPRWRTVAYFLALGMAFVYLTGASGAYFTMVWILYPQAFAFLGQRWGTVAAIPITLLWTWRQGLLEDIGDNPVNLLVVVGSVGVAAAMGAFVWSITSQNDEKQRIIEALEAARADLVEVAAAKGALEERERLAREIHDTLAQGFTGVVMQLEAAEQFLDPSGEARHHLDSARHIARDSLAAVRKTVSDLRPDLLDDGGLPEALQRTTSRVRDHWGLDADTVVTGTAVPLGTDAEVALLRVAQEALANVTKHADAQRVRLTLSYLDAEVTLDVRDDGIGFDPTAGATHVGVGSTDSDRHGGFGLTSMAERIAGLGGAFTVESEPGSGTAVMARVPVAASQVAGPVESPVAP